MSQEHIERYWVTAAQLSIIETVVCGPETKRREAPETFKAVLESIRTKQVLSPQHWGASRYTQRCQMIEEHGRLTSEEE